MNDMNELIGSRVEESVLDGDLGELLKTVEMVALDSGGFDVRRGEEVQLVLLDLALLAHEEQVLGGRVVESGE